jgi:hypothetical protein
MGVHNDIVIGRFKRMRAVPLCAARQGIIKRIMKT